MVEGPGLVDATAVMGYLANGIVFGSILALAAVGLSLVYGILRLSNFAHGDLVSFGAFAALFLTRQSTAKLVPVAIGVALIILAFTAADRFRWKRLSRGELIGAIAAAALLILAPLTLRVLGTPPSRTTDLVLLVGTIVACGVTVVLTVGLDFAIWRPLRQKRATLLTLIIVSIGLALIIRNVLLLEFGGGIHGFARPTSVSKDLLGVPVSEAQRFTVVAAAVLVGALHVFLRYTRTGKAMRAVADNTDLARSCGINVDRIITYVWIISAVLVTISGVLLTLVNNNTMNVNMGFGLLLPLFAAVLLGGIGSPYGAVLGGLIVGIGMKLSVLWLGNEYEFATAFGILILVLLLRPTGILGVRQ